MTHNSIVCIFESMLKKFHIEKWKGNVPNTVLGSNQNLMFGLNK